MTIDLKKAFYMEPEEIVKYFESKGLKTSYNWREVNEEAHAKAFTVAKMTDAALLKDTHDMLTKAIKEGWSADHFQKEAGELFAKKGWTGIKEVTNPHTGEKETVELGTPRRIKNIFQNNINSAYAVGRYKQQLEDVDIAPYFQYMCVLDEATRPEHRAMHGKVFRYDDPFWATFYPPNGWGCRCFVRSLSANEVKKLGLTVEKSGINEENKNQAYPSYNRRSSSDVKPTNPIYPFKLGTKEYTLQADEGWATNMGAHAWNLDVLTYNKIEKLPQELKDTFISQMAQNVYKEQSFKTFVDSIIAHDMKPRKLELAITWISPELLKTITKDNVNLKTPVIVMQDDRVGHIMGTRTKLNKEQFYNIYNIINNPDEIYYDYTQKGVTSLAYIKNIPESDNAIKVCVKLSRYNKKTKNPVNYLSTAGIIKRSDMMDKSHYKKIE